ncbi:MAG: carbon starvation protein A, partial [Planctomycetes bacterium]|nr:carbon starvation protein A [Planctomycetota bacterium]
MPIALGLGYSGFKKNARVIGSTAIVVGAMYFFFFYGRGHLVSVPALGFITPAGGWGLILLIDTRIASTLPVTVLLQPRDYINAWQLFIAMGLLYAGAVVSGVSGKMSMVAPAVNHNLPEGTLSIWPFMFVVIACGAISGFHSLVASGTSSKQVAKESDSLFIGYGSMLMEGVLAVLVLICVGAGIGMSLTTADGSILSGSEAWGYQYSSWIGAKGLSDKLAPVINGAANMFGSI